MPTQKDQQIKAIMTMLSSSVTKSDFEEGMKALISYVKKTKDTNEQEWTLIHSAFSMLQEKLNKGHDAALEKSEKKLDKALADLLKRHNESLDEIDKLKPEKGDKGDKGDDADEEKITAAILSNIPAPIIYTPHTIRDNLESLEGEDRLDAKAIKNLPALAKKLIGLGATRGFQLLINSNKKGLANFFNLIAGTGVTLTYSYNNGRNDVTISSTASGSGPTAPSGTVNGTNNTFTASSTPTIVFTEGGSFTNGFGVTITGTTIVFAAGLQPQQWIYYI